MWRQLALPIAISVPVKKILFISSGYGNFIRSPLGADTVCVANWRHQIDEPGQSRAMTEISLSAKGDGVFNVLILNNLVIDIGIEKMRRYQSLLSII